MALLVKIERVGTVTKYLKAENITPSRTRKVTTAPLPGGTVLQLDMGISKPAITVTGTADNSRVDTGNNGIANYYEILGFDAWYASTIRLYYDTGSYLQGKIDKLDVRRQPWEDYWHFSLTFSGESITL